MGEFPQHMVILISIQDLSGFDNFATDLMNFLEKARVENPELFKTQEYKELEESTLEFIASYGSMKKNSIVDWD